MCERTQRLHMQFLTTIKPVKSTCHKMMAIIALKQTTFTHFDSAIRGHFVVGIFDAAVALRVIEFFVAIAADAVKLQDPVAKAVTRFNLTGPYFVGVRVPRDNGLCSCAAR
jgi:hypothetical protein